jgi:NADH-quinone oxidoreductase subunit G
MATIYIDDKSFEVEEGENILQAVLGLGLDLPYFCWHPAMGSVGACRQCALVQFRDEEDTRGRIVMGCMTPVTDGARFSMQGPDATVFRKNIVESLMLNHPHDCPVCAEGGECHLQDMTVMVGHRNRSYRGRKNTHNNQNLGPLIHHEMNRCISCYRCTRYYNDYAGGTDLAAQASHDHVYFGRHQDGTLESEFAGNLVEVCPTGVFTDKPLVNEYTRKWDLQSAPSVCTGCSAGCNIMPGERYGKLKRVHNRYNSEVNGYFLCDRGRFGASYVNDESRPCFAGLRNSSGSYDAIESSAAIQKMVELCGAGKKVVGIGSPRASLEANVMLSQLVGKENFCGGMADYEAELVEQSRSIMASGAILSPSMSQVETADAVLILGEDVTNTTPRLALALRQSVRNLASEMATDMRIPLWQDEAVRNLAQDQLSPLFIAAMSDTRLDDVAQASVAMTPNEIAHFGNAIAAKIDPTLPAVNGLDEATEQLAITVAKALADAKRPLLVSGTGAQSRAVIDAAAAIAKALDTSRAMLSLCFHEANSLGLAMQTHSDSALTIQAVCELATAGDIDTLLVLENDLYRRASKSQIDQLLADVGNLIAMDSLANSTLGQAQLSLPSATFLESEGTLVSNEGRAQRHYPVFQATEQRQASWKWLLQLGKTLGIETFNKIDHFDEVTTLCAECNSCFNKISLASPNSEFRDRGMKVPRQTHRASGRTAMRADISVHEPKQPEDQDTPFSFSMEGANSGKSGALIPFVWSPGWNSNQSLHKFQSEAGGALSGGTPGVRLFEVSDNAQLPSLTTADNSDQGQASGLSLLPLYRIFGSDELTARSPAIAELCSRPGVRLNNHEAKELGLKRGDWVAINLGQDEVELEVTIDSSVPNRCAALICGVPGASWLAPNTCSTLRKIEAKLVVEKVASSGGSHD